MSASALLRRQDSNNVMSSSQALKCMRLFLLVTGLCFVLVFMFLIHSQSVQLSINQEHLAASFFGDPRMTQGFHKASGTKKKKEAPAEESLFADVGIMDTLKHLVSDTFIWGSQDDDSDATLIPVDLSVNFLSPIPWEDDLILTTPTIPSPKDVQLTTEDFLPLVVADAQHLDLRFRLKPMPGASRDAIQDITAYQIKAADAYDTSHVLWDSGKVQVDVQQHEYDSGGLPRSIPWGGDIALLKPGTMVQWQVAVWDALGNGPFYGEPSKFAVGPSHDEWHGKWITHPTDYQVTVGHVRTIRGYINPQMRMHLCDRFKQRRPLPLARAAFKVKKHVQSALLVASGLGSFMVTMNGSPLSSSSIMDPPLTDFTQRVNYRGYDVTPFLNSATENVVGITLGSGWWDDLPLQPKIVNPELMPKGLVTTIAQLHVTYTDGSTEVLIPTDGVSEGSLDNTTQASNGEVSAWKIGKGHIIESNLYTGETVNVQTLLDNAGWDTPSGIDKAHGKSNAIEWVTPMLYATVTTQEEWRGKLQTAAVENRATKVSSSIQPIGKLRPLQMPPVMPIERIQPDTIRHMGDGRWLVDFGKAFSGVVRFENGLPTPLAPTHGAYPRGHAVNNTYPGFDGQHISLIYGETIEMETGDINTAVVAGFGYHDGGYRKSNDNRMNNAGACLPRDPNYGTSLLQRDVYLMPRSGGEYAAALQARFSFNGMRFVEVCCSKDRPEGIYAIKYRTKFSVWGGFDSSNTTLNAAYEMTLNAFDSNTIGIQSDCPHREKLQYGGDISANSYSALHHFDLSAFYNKVIEDWTESQWDNGGYVVTSVYMDLLQDRSVVGRGAGETVWAALPPVLTARHMQNYGDVKLLERTLPHHVKWMEMLMEHWDAGIDVKYPGVRTYYNYSGQGSGLGDWLALIPRDSWLTHYGHYLASIRGVIYAVNKLEQYGGIPSTERPLLAAIKEKSVNKAAELEDLIRKVYGKGEDCIFTYKPDPRETPEGLGANYAVFSSVAEGRCRCTTLHGWLKTTGMDRERAWPGDEERLFHNTLHPDLYKELLQEGYISPRKNYTRYYMYEALNSGILDLKYTLKTLSDYGFHDLALSKSSSKHFPGFGYMASFNATTAWETWWRSEDLFSHNHPMFGAISEWLASSVAGVYLAPTTVGGEELVFWPRIPKETTVLEYASAEQGTKRGDAAIAWQFRSIQKEKSAQVVIRILVPPASKATLHLDESAKKVTIRSAVGMPDFYAAKELAKVKCRERRDSSKYGFPFFYHYDRFKNQWTKVNEPQKLGTPCRSYLWDLEEETEGELEWSHYEWKPKDPSMPKQALQPGLFEVIIEEWPLGPHFPTNIFNNYDISNMGPYCADESQFKWDINDALHLV